MRVFLIKIFLYISFWGIFFFYNDTVAVAQENPKTVFLNEHGLVLEINSGAETVADFLAEQNIKLNEKDVVVPARETKIFTGSQIILLRNKKITVAADGQEKEINTILNNVDGALVDGGIVLGEDDIVVPERSAFIADGKKIKITRVEIKEEIKNEAIDFKKISEEDAELSWRVKKVKQKGEKGNKEVKYKVVAHNGKEISRKILASKITKEPVSEIAVQGTFVKTGKARTGVGTWYAWKGGMFAASTTLPKGSYARVTNVANGSSIIVQINDYGPQGKGRIIDLDKVAFAKIASLGAGVIGVKVEPVLN